MASVLGAGVPIAYMFLQPGTQIDWNHDARGKVVNEFLQCLKVRLPNLKPKFVFTDKDSGQINAIKAVFGITPSICFWHMKRAVKKKIAKIVQEERVRISKEDVAKLIQLLHKQYCIHPYLDENRTVEQVRVCCLLGN